jgi:hypothetical protein
MSVRVIAQGKDFMCFVRTGTTGSYVWKPIANQTGCTLTDDPEDIESNAKNLNGWSNYFDGLKRWEATVETEISDESDISTAEIDFNALQDYKVAGTKPTFAFAWAAAKTSPTDTPTIDTTKRMYTGVGLVRNNLNGNPNELATSSLRIRGCLKLEYVDPT